MNKRSPSLPLPTESGRRRCARAAAGGHVKGRPTSSSGSSGLAGERRAARTDQGELCEREEGVRTHAATVELFPDGEVGTERAQGTRQDNRLMRG